MQKWFFLITVVTVSFLGPACSRVTDTAVDTKEEEKNIRQVFDKYLESVKTADVALASQIWLQSPNVSAVTPLGRFKGWESVRDDLYVNFLQKAFTDRNLQAENFAVTVSGNAAWSVYDWTFTAKLPNGQPFSSKGWESHVYQKTEGRWVIAHLHYSSPVQLPAQPPQ
jgi:ketosteroid isomerase-like protein